MDNGTRVTLSVTFEGIVLSSTDDGVCTVRWDSGVVERVHESELELAGAPPEVDEEEGYSQDDPKHPGYHDHLAGHWDTRPGK